MIPFNNLGHCYKKEIDGSLPIIWLDSSDSSSFVVGAADVLTSANNKGTLGGQFDLFGNVRYLNSGFEGHVFSDYIEYDLNEPFFTDNSFTVAVAYDYNVRYETFQYSMNLGGQDASNRVTSLHINNNESIWAVNSGTFSQLNGGAALGKQTVLYTYDLLTNQGVLLLNSGIILNTSLPFNNTNDIFVTLLGFPYGSNGGLGQDNPLFEFRLYNVAFTLTEMQDLQTELNNKYI